MIEAAVAVVITALYLVVSLSFLSSLFGGKTNSSELRAFLDKGFLATQVRYQEYLVDNGYCFTDDPPDYGLTDYKGHYSFWTDASDGDWFNPGRALFKIDPNPDTGRVDRFKIIIKRDFDADIPESSFQVYPYLIGSEQVGSEIHYTYEKQFILNKGWRVMYSTTDQSCVQPY
ncbi:hypothetical protein F7U66_00210 [Vibrio parahaemolyticus]|nr:hypothetical protein [Vibrio parahaemolyticus]